MQFIEVGKVANAWAKYIVQQSRTRLTKGKQNVNKDLYNSIKGQVKDGRSGYEIIVSMLDYGKFQDEGVRGKIASPINTKNSPFRFKNKMPPYETISSWAKKKNIRFRDDKGRFAKGNYNTIGYVIAKSIQQKGIKATFFLTRSYELSNKLFDPRLAMAVGQDIAREIRKQAKKVEQQANKKK